MKKMRFGLLLLLLVLSVSACGFPLRYTQVRGNGKITSESRNVIGFNSIELSGIGTLIIEQGEEESLEVTAEENLMRYLRSDVRGSSLKLGMEEFISLQPTEDIIYRLSVKNLQNIETSGLGSVEIEYLETEQLEIEISGSGKIVIGNLIGDRLIIEISGLGDVDVAGKVEDQRVKLSGAGNYDATDLQSVSAKLDISGTGRANLWVTETLDVDLSGAGTITYYGDPNVHSEMSGLGEIKSLGEK